MSEEESDSKSQFSEQSALFDPEKQRKVRARLEKMRQKNDANRRMRAFRSLLQKKDTGK